MLFKGKYFFLSNFSPCMLRVNINGKDLIFSSVEAAFQAHKNFELADKFVLLKPLEAKRYGKKIPLTTANWDIERIYIMARLLTQKFKDPVLFASLKNINEEIAEDNYWGDTFWGICKGKGDNVLGKLIMYIRDNDNDYTKVTECIEQDLIAKYLSKK